MDTVRLSTSNASILDTARVNLNLCISLVNGISQEKEKDFPIRWEIFLGDEAGDLNPASDCHVQIAINLELYNHPPPAVYSWSMGINFARP